jgi:hypothetical protein
VCAKGKEHAGVQGGKHQGATAAGGQVRKDHAGNHAQKWRGKCLLVTAELLLHAHVTKTILAPHYSIEKLKNQL